ncbi:MAG: hypothetical protein FD166_2833 [Bacteroidetes bacterium]|nr:MAG: hypothetical protein FD166_2833 [Bacteroidota bacterium]
MEKKKSYVTESSIKGFQAEINKAVSPADINRLLKIAEKYGIEFGGEMRVNLNRWWRAILPEMDKLPDNDPFKKELVSVSRWQFRKDDLTIILDFIRHTKRTDEHKFISSPMWSELQLKLIELTDKHNLPSIGAATYISLRGNVQSYYTPYLKVNADKGAIQFTESLKASIDKAFKGLALEDKTATIYALLEYINYPLNNGGREMDTDTLHNIIFKGQ